MSTLTGDDLPVSMAEALTGLGADLDDETICTFLLARGSEFLLREITDHLDEAIANAADHCGRELAELRRDIDAELAR